MAATSLWHIEGRLKDLISYVENPEKTVPNKEMQDFFDVFSYVKNPQKTDNGEFVSAINCLKETALQQIIYCSFSLPIPSDFLPLTVP